MAELTPLAPSTRKDDCYRVLKEAILNLDLAPGSPLDEVQIASQLGTSKTPVREALARLSGEGFVVTSPGRRSQVAGLSIETIRETYQARILLESASIREVAPLLTPDDLTRLDQLIRASATALAAEDIRGWVAATEGFHEFLLWRTGNQTLLSIARTLFDQANRVRAAIFRVEQQVYEGSLMNNGLRNHRLILDALGHHDGDLAAQLIRWDIQLFLDAVSTPEMRAAFEQLAFSRQSTVAINAGCA